MPFRDDILTFVGTVMVLLGLMSCSMLGERSPRSEALREVARIHHSPLTAKEAAMAAEGIRAQGESFQNLHGHPYALTLTPAFDFLPFNDKAQSRRQKLPSQWVLAPSRNPSKTDWATASVAEMNRALRSGQVTSLELTRYFLDRIQKHDSKINALITINEKEALARARQMDQEIKKKNFRSPLHGIPYLAKDIFATQGLPTTWGAKPYIDQQLAYDATAIHRLREAGAILLGKTSLGALAWGDQWFGGQTKNPHNLAEGALGSSAGSAAGVSAGFAPLALGSETWGSLITPAERVGVVALRPSFGVVSRYGVMPLSWTMDKVGLICRYVSDCLLGLTVIAGHDPKDSTTLKHGFNFETPSGPKRSKMKFVHIKPDETYSEEFKNWYAQWTKELRSEETPLVANPFEGVRFESLALILKAEATAAFSNLSLSGRDEELLRQGENAYPNYFREGRFIPAAEYIQMNRIRRALMVKTEERFNEYDVVVAPAQGDHLLLTNLTGHPAVYLPLKTLSDGRIAGVTLMGAGLTDDALLILADELQKKGTMANQLPQDL